MQFGFPSNLYTTKGERATIEVKLSNGAHTLNLTRSVLGDTVNMYCIFIFCFICSHVNGFLFDGSQPLSTSMYQLIHFAKIYMYLHVLKNKTNRTVLYMLSYKEIFTWEYNISSFRL